MRVLTVTLFVALLACLVSVNALGSSPAPSKATVQHTGDSYEAETEGQGPEYSGDSDEYYSEDKKEADVCPDAQPADSVKQVWRGHAIFHWGDMADMTRRSQGRIQSMDSAWGSKAVRNAFNKDRRSTRDHKTTAAVNDGKTLFPSKIKELDGFYGTTDPVNYPTYQGLAVGKHPTDPEMVFMLHTVNCVAEMFLTESDGHRSDLNRPSTKIHLGDLQELVGLGYDQKEYKCGEVTAFYDPKDRRYAIVWSTQSDETGLDYAPPVFVAVSQTRNPLGDWTVWALDLRPTLAAGYEFCHNGDKGLYKFEYPQVSFSHDGIFIAGSSSCPGETDTMPRISLAALYVLPKAAIYAKPPASDQEEATIKAAVYIIRNSWYRSITENELSLTPDSFEPFNSIPCPARPQTIEDMKAAPLFVLKVDNAHLSVATLTDDCPLGKMNSIDSAPKIRAVVVGKGADYAAAEGYSAGKAIAPQPETDTVLELNYLGMENNFGGLVFWATQYKGQLYLTTGEYWGYDYIRMPSIYWAIIKVTEDICTLTRKDHGLVASADGLALMYPVIAAREKGGALLAFAYSGKDRIANGQHQAYPGVASAIVGHRQGANSDKTIIHIIKKGKVSLNPFPLNRDDSIPWGIGSAAQVCGDQMWFSVNKPVSKDDSGLEDLVYDPWYGSWITWQQL